LEDEKLSSEGSVDIPIIVWNLQDVEEDSVGEEVQDVGGESQSIQDSIDFNFKNISPHNSHAQQESSTWKKNLIKKFNFEESQDLNCDDFGEVSCGGETSDGLKEKSVWEMMKDYDDSLCILGTRKSQIRRSLTPLKSHRTRTRGNHSEKRTQDLVIDCNHSSGPRRALRSLGEPSLENSLNKSNHNSKSRNTLPSSRFYSTSLKSEPSKTDHNSKYDFRKRKSFIDSRSRQMEVKEKRAKLDDFAKRTDKRKGTIFDKCLLLNSSVLKSSPESDSNSNGSNTQINNHLNKEIMREIVIGFENNVLVVKNSSQESSQLQNSAFCQIRKRRKPVSRRKPSTKNRGRLNIQTNVNKGMF
jgi:hypothetical protein